MLISSLSLSQALPCVLRSLTWGRSSTYHSLDGSTAGSLGLISLCSPNACETSLQCLLNVLVMITAKIQVFPPPHFWTRNMHVCVHLSLCKASTAALFRILIQHWRNVFLSPSDAKRHVLHEGMQPQEIRGKKKQAWPKVKVSNSVLQGEHSLIPLSLHPEEALCRKSIQIAFSLGFYCIAHHPITT